MTQTVDKTFLTPEGRFVGGSLHEPQTKGHGGEILKKPIMVVKIALTKGQADVEALINHIKAIGAVEFANDPIQLQKPMFAWKIIDGDSAIPNDRGVVPNTREGYPGCWILTLSTKFDFDCCGVDCNVNVPANAIKKGYYIRLAGDIKGNDRQDKPGVFLNLKGAQCMREGEIIAGGFTPAATLFGGGQPAPVAPSAVVAGMAAAVAQQPAAVIPGMVQVAPVQPGAPVAPAHDIVAGALAVVPTPPGPPAPPVAPTGPILTPGGVAAGCDPVAWAAADPRWTHVALRSAGYIV